MIPHRDRRAAADGRHEGGESVSSWVVGDEGDRPPVCRDVDLAEVPDTVDRLQQAAAVDVPHLDIAAIAGAVWFCEHRRIPVGGDRGLGHVVGVVNAGPGREKAGRVLNKQHIARCDIADDPAL